MSNLQTLNAELNARVQELAHIMEQILQAERAKDWVQFEKLAAAMNVHHDKVNVAMSAMAAYQAPR